MNSQSILVNLTNCTIADRRNDSDQTVTREHVPISESDEILCDDAGRINGSRKKLKVAQDKAIAISGSNDDSTETTSQVWQYAVRCPNSNFSICCLCPNRKKISTNNESTSTLRRHLITQHQLHELKLPNKECYEPPIRFSVTRLLKHLHNFHLKKLIDNLSIIDDISITLDLWSNRQMRSFLVITGHFFLHNSFDLTSTVLSFSTFNCHHKSIDILRILQDKLKEPSILHKVIRVTTDGGRNVARVVYDMNLNLKRIWCVAHRLHLSITNAFGLWIVRKDDDNGTGALEQ
ncbi:unnamed protein product, partial [Rotaria magnacalcarata]